jgi:hypothetical protein
MITPMNYLNASTGSRVRRLALGGVGALLLAACNTTLSLDTDNLQNLIKTEIEAQNAANGVTVSSVDCPERPIQQGDVFNCTAVTNAGTYTVKVTQTDATGNVHWEIVQQ